MLASPASRGTQKASTAGAELHQHWMCAMRIEPAVLIETAATPITDHHRGLWDELALFWRQFIVEAFNPYRPEKHYMRGPGPAWHAKHGTGAAS